MTSRRSDERHDGLKSPQSTAVTMRLRQGVLWSVVATCTIFILGIILAQFHLSWLWDVPDEFTYDWRTALFSEVASDQRKDIALVLIDDNSVARYWSRSPVDRGLIAELVKAVDAAQPRAIGLDFVFDRRSEPSRDTELAKAIKGAIAPVILGVTTKREGPIDQANLDRQDEFISDTGDPEPRPAGTLFFGEQEGGITLGDNVIRAMGAPDKGNKYNKTFDMLLAGLDGQKNMPANHLISWLLPPKNKKSDMFTTLHISTHDPVDGTGDGHTVLPNYLHAALKNKIVIIGGDFIDRDQHRIPLSVETKAPASGAFIHAQIIAQLIDKRAIIKVPPICEVGIDLLICLVAFLISSRYFLFGIELFSHFVFLVAIVLTGFFLFSEWSIVLTTSTMAAGWVLGIIGGGHYERIAPLMMAPLLWMVKKRSAK
jgi:adenylate cyclase